MPGTLTLSTLSDGTNSTSATNCIQGSAKAWVNFNGTTSPGTIRASYNVSSVTKNGTGDYTVNFTSALTDANYAAVTNTGGAGVSSSVAGDNLTARTTTVFRFYSLNTSGAGTDSSFLSVAIFR